MDNVGEASETADDATAAGVRKFFLAFVGALFVIGAAGTLWIFGGSDDEADRAAEARAVCEQWVRDELRSPSTASFSEVQIDGADPSWAIAGVVDAENAFGGTVRSGWGCGIRYQDGQWTGSVELAPRQLLGRAENTSARGTFASRYFSACNSTAVIR